MRHLLNLSTANFSTANEVSLLTTVPSNFSSSLNLLGGCFLEDLGEGVLDVDGLVLDEKADERGRCRWFFVIL